MLSTCIIFLLIVSSCYRPWDQARERNPIQKAAAVEVIQKVHSVISSLSLTLYFKFFLVGVGYYDEGGRRSKDDYDMERLQKLYSSLKQENDQLKEQVRERESTFKLKLLFFSIA